MSLLILNLEFMGIKVQEMKIYDDDTPYLIQKLGSEKIKHLVKKKNYLCTFQNLKIIKNQDTINALEDIYSFYSYYSSLGSSHVSLICFLEMNVIYEEAVSLCDTLSIKLTKSLKLLYRFNKNYIICELKNFYYESENVNFAVCQLKNILDYLTKLLSILRTTKVKIDKNLQNLIESYVLETPITLDVYDTKDRYVAKVDFSGVWFPGLKPDYNSYNSEDSMWITNDDAYFYIVNDGVEKIRKIQLGYQQLFSTLYKFIFADIY